MVHHAHAHAMVHAHVQVVAEAATDHSPSHPHRHQHVHIVRVHQSRLGGDGGCMPSASASDVAVVAELSVAVAVRVVGSTTDQSTRTDEGTESSISTTERI